MEMELRRFKNLTNEQLRVLIKAQRENKVIIIKGTQGPTGKSTLKRALREKGYTAYEEYEIVELELNEIIENPIPNAEEYYSRTLK